MHSDGGSRARWQINNGGVSESGRLFAVTNQDIYIIRVPETRQPCVHLQVTIIGMFFLWDPPCVCPVQEHKAPHRYVCFRTMRYEFAINVSGCGKLLNWMSSLVNY